MKNYGLGLIGGVIAGIIAALPWLLLYVYGGYILFILPTLIAYGFQFGYRKLNGPADKVEKILVVIIPILITTVMNFVVVPLLVLAKDGYVADFYNLGILYRDSSYMMAVLQDFVISIIFTIIGSILAIKNKNQKNA